MIRKTKKRIASLLAFGIIAMMFAVQVDAAVPVEVSLGSLPNYYAGKVNVQTNINGSWGGGTGTTYSGYLATGVGSNSIKLPASYTSTSYTFHPIYSSTGVYNLTLYISNGSNASTTGKVTIN